jgi:hypothetical protein
MADCEAIAMGDRTVPKAENYPCLQTKVSSTVVCTPFDRTGSWLR